MKKAEKFNFWFIIGVSGAIVMVMVSLIVYNSYVAYELPIDIPLRLEEGEDVLAVTSGLKEPIRSNCYHLDGEKRLINKKDLLCTFSINYSSENPEYYFRVVNVTYFSKNDGTYTIPSPRFDREWINKTPHVSIAVNKSIDQTYVKVYFGNDNGTTINTGGFFIFQEESLELQDYDHRKERGLALFLTVLSIGVFSFLSAIKVLRDLYNGNKD